MSDSFIENSNQIPFSLEKIIVSGLRQTDETVLKKQFVGLAESTNFRDVVINIEDVQQRLKKLGVFRYVYAVIDVADTPGKYKVTFKVEEKRPTTARLSVTRGTDGTSKLCGSIRMNNLMHGAEFFDLDLESTTNLLTSKCATFSKPLESNPYVRFSVGGTDGCWDHWWAKFLRTERSVFSEIRADSPLGLHRFQWDATWREIEAKDNSTPWTVRKESGSTLKFGLRHTFEVDRRSDLVFPESGYLFRLSKEVASITPGDPTGSQNVDSSSPDRALQFKLEGIVQKPFRLADWLVGELTFSSGLAHSLTGHPIHIADRFFIGGPLELRGFQWRTVGPLEPLLQPTVDLEPSPAGEESAQSTTAPLSPVGSEGFWLTGAHLYTPLPYFGASESSLASQFRLHGFCLIGSTMESPISRLSQSLRNCSSVLSASQNLLGDLCDKSRAVVGAGLAIRFAGCLRIEINYCIPVSTQPGDLIMPGFSFGFGMYYS